MRKVVLTEFLTLDGVMEDPSSWQREVTGVDDGPFKTEELFESDALLLGRVTYEEFLTYWPTASGTGAFGDRMNSLPKYVATTTLTSLEWNATALQGDVAEAVMALKHQEGGTILMYGSGTLARSLLQRGVVDEVRLLIYPLVLGSGKRLFSAEGRLSLRLVSARELGGGTVLLTYAPTTV